MTRTRAAAGAAALTLALALTGCADGPRGGSDQPGVQGPQSVAPGPAGDSQRVELNRASEKDLAATLRASGVDDPENWAQILVQNRPYPAGAAGAAKVRQVLDQFKADPQNIAKITNVVIP